MATFTVQRNQSKSSVIAPILRTGEINDIGVKGCMNFLVATNFDDVFSRRAQNPYMKATPADETGVHSRFSCNGVSSIPRIAFVANYPNCRLRTYYLLANRFVVY